MRGKVPILGAMLVIGRITPAYAGKSSCYGRTQFPYRDHPRLCGEKFCLESEPSKITGSPPPMRGKAGCKISRLRCGRITPAYAGKSGSHTSNKIIYRDHPRLCGEKQRGQHSQR